MADWLIYLIKVISFQAAMIIFYLVFLRKLTFYGFNRGFLMGTLVLGFILPLVQLEGEPLDQVNAEIVNQVGATFIARPIEVIQEIEPVNNINWSVVVLLFYLSGLGIMAQRFFTNLNRIRNLKNELPLIHKIGQVQVFRTLFTQPFSFFNSVCIPRQVEDTQEMELVMAHELQHVRFGHSYDRMLVDFMIVLLWFNPFIYLLRKCLIEVHEYQVDAAVTSTPQSRVPYQISLVNLAGGGFSGPVSFFNFSTIKRRIQMMNRNKSKKVSLVRLVLLVPMFLGLMVLFSFKMNSTINQVNDLQSNDDNSFREMGNERPSIMPVGSGQQFHVSSGVGKRTDPILKVQRWHLGLDVSAKIGTIVIAAGDGRVVEVEQKVSGYGLYIVIQHSEMYKTRYAHLSAQHVKVGEMVTKGQLIGEVGNSGKSVHPHLHYEVMENDVYVNPVDFIEDYTFSEAYCEEEFESMDGGSH